MKAKIKLNYKEGILLELRKELIVTSNTGVKFKTGKVKATRTSSAEG